MQPIAFAADVSHELKNLIASLRSALERLGHASAMRRYGPKLLDIAQDDVRRLDRLVTEIAEASRIDAPTLAHAVRAASIWAGSSAASPAASRPREGDSPPSRIVLRAACAAAIGLAMGDPQKLRACLENLLDNARSFSPGDGRIRVAVEAQGESEVTESSSRMKGPASRSASARRSSGRFHSVRPAQEDFGRHSGLGLAIARTDPRRPQWQSSGWRTGRMVLRAPASASPCRAPDPSPIKHRPTTPRAEG